VRTKEAIMKRLAIVLVAATGIAGCVAVPVADPGPYYYTPAPAVVVQPSVGFYYDYHRHYGPRRRW
jgi:hypothetical protein